MGASESMGSSAGTSSQLLRSVARGENEAWNRLMELYRPRILSWCREKGLDDASAQDIAQDTFLAIYQSLGKFRSNPGSGAFRAWMNTIVARRIADSYRKLHGQPSAIGGSSFAERIQALPSESDSSGSSSALAGRLDQLQDVSAKYEPRTWEAFLRCVIDGRSTAEVATEFGMTAVGVRQLRSRILRHIRNRSLP